MNERIKELAMELAEQYDWDPPHDPTYYTFSSDDLKKFAELIVKETLQVARAGIEYGDGMEDAVYKYFGVEE